VVRQEGVYRGMNRVTEFYIPAAYRQVKRTDEKATFVIEEVKNMSRDIDEFG